MYLEEFMKALILTLFWFNVSSATMITEANIAAKQEKVLKIPPFQVLGEFITLKDSIMFVDPRILINLVEWRIASVHSGKSGDLNMEWF